MKIILICGMSGTGKTTIVKKIYEQYSDKYNVVCSYTDRQKRSSNEWGHKFINSSLMDYKLEHDDIVAQTKIEKYRYCSTVSQFSKDKINLYIADSQGIEDTIKSFPTADIMTVLICRNEIEADCVRSRRDVIIPDKTDVDFIINNNTTIMYPVDILHALAMFDLFNKPSHIEQTIDDKLENIDKKYRLLDAIQSSLYVQLFYQEQLNYAKLCTHVGIVLNKEFSFDIKVKKDYEPDIYDGDLVFNIIVEYHADLRWDEIHNLIEKTTVCAYKYCEDNNLDDISGRLYICEHWEPLDE